jgi:hypothetical protein
MPGKIRLLLISLFLSGFASAQQPDKPSLVDTSFTDYDALFNELDALLDSLTKPRSFFLVDIGMTTGYFSYESKTSYLLETQRRNIYTPSIAYLSKTGLGISATAAVIHDVEHMNPYQVYVTGSYDYLKSMKFITGIAFSRFFTKRDLNFYTSPLRNEVYAYFTWKKSWLKPSAAFSYGWGNRSDYKEQEDYIYSMQLGMNGFTRINTEEHIRDFNIHASVRHDFYWWNILGKTDYIRVTPQFVFTAGTQQFGFNQTSNTYATIPRTGANVLFVSERVFLDNQLVFQPLSLTANLKAEYSKGKFFIQPMLMFDYYFPAPEKNLNTAFLLNAGVIF